MFLEFADLVEDALELALEVAQGVLRLLLGDVATADEILGVGLADALLTVDHLVHPRLGHRRVVGLVVPATAVADEVDHDVLLELLTEVHREAGDAHTRLGVAAVDVEDRRADHLGDVRGVLAGAAGLGGGREPDLVVDHDVDRPTGAVTVDLGEVERLGDDTLAGERGVTVQHERHDRVLGAPLRVLDEVLLGADDALENRVDRLEVGRVGRERDLDLVLAEHLVLDAFGAEVVLHVARTVRGRGVHVALELREDLAVGLADDVRQHVEATAVRHADDDLVQAELGGLVDDRVHHRDDGLGALEGEPLLTHVLGLQEGLECLGGVDLGQDVLLLGDGRLVVDPLDALLDPLALFVLEDVGVLDADLATVGGAQRGQHVAQTHLVLADESTDGEPAVEVPQGELVRVDVEIRVEGAAPLRVLPVEWVDVGHEVAAIAVRGDELQDAGVLVDAGIGDVLAPPDGLVRDAEGVEDLVVELVREEQAVDLTQELAGLRALDDPVIVGRGQGGDLADGVVGQLLLAGTLELGGVLHGAHTEDRALTHGQTGHRVHGADTARVGQRDRDAREVVHRQLALAGAGDDVLVGVEEAAEVERLTVADGRDDERATGLGLHVDGQSEVDPRRGDGVRLAVDLLVVVVHIRVRLDGLHHRVPDEVGEGDLPTVCALEMIVDDHPVVDHQLGRDRADGGRGRQ